MHGKLGSVAEDDTTTPLIGTERAMAMYLLRRKRHTHAKKKPGHKGCGELYLFAFSNNNWNLLLLNLYDFLITLSMNLHSTVIWKGGGGGGRSTWPVLAQ